MTTASQLQPSSPEAVGTLLDTTNCRVAPSPVGAMVGPGCSRVLAPSHHSHSGPKTPGQRTQAAPRLVGSGEASHTEPAESWKYECIGPKYSLESWNDEWMVIQQAKSQMDEWIGSPLHWYAKNQKSNQIKDMLLPQPFWYQIEGGMRRRQAHVPQNSEWWQGRCRTKAA